MNSLNLRVSSVKTGENIRKNAELRTTLMQLPPKYLSTSNSLAKQFENARTIPDQVNVVKSIYETSHGDMMALEFLADVYFDAPLKHPVRNQVAKLLQNTKPEIEQQLLNVLSTAISTLLDRATENSSCADLNQIVATLSGCFDNFSRSLHSLGENIYSTFVFLSESLEKYMYETSLQSSPSGKNELYLFIHNLIRFALACIQEYSEILSDNAKSKIDQLKNPARNLTLDIDMPMDVKTNCGILIAYIAKIHEKYAEHVGDVASESVTEENDCLVLCLCIGVINTCSAEAFEALKDDVKVIIGKICYIANKYSTEPPMLLSATRILFQVSKLLLSVEIIRAEDDAVKTIIRSLTGHILSYIEHNMDSVRHICKDLIRNIIKINTKFHFDDLQNELFETCQKTDTPLSIKCTLLIAISNTIGTNVILKRFPTLLDELVTGGLGNDLNVTNCYDNLMISNHKEVEFNEWKNCWIMPLIKLGASNKELLASIEILINKAIKCEPKVVDILIDIENTEIPLSTRLSALWTIRKNALQAKNFQSILKTFANVLTNVMISNDDDTKMIALRLVVESHKTTEPLSDVECETLFEFLQYNSNCQSPAIRQQSLGLISKGLLRLKVSFEKSVKQRDSRIEFYGAFLKKLIDLLMGNLFPGANFSRRFLTLSLLEQSVNIVLDCKENVATYFPEEYINKLIGVLNDSYESNKVLANSILKSIVKNDSQQISLDTIQDLMTSVRPTDSLTAAYHLEYFCFQAQPSDFGPDKSIAVKHSVEFAAIRWCINILGNALNCAENSILLAARKNPLYGTLQTIRHVLSKLDFKELVEDIVWQEVFIELIRLCKISTHVVGPIVNSSSPEGHLPNDFSEIPEYLGTVENEKTDGRHYKILSSKQDIKAELLKTTPQMVLLCAWRTVKEVSLLLGEIVLRAPIKSPSTANFLITVDQIIDIGAHFKELLAETKHRGAFEQAYVGFSKVCTRLWRTEHVELYKLPMQWLSELIDIISKDEKINEKICATRRSAGVPFMVQALITSELQVGTTKALTFCMKHLLALCSDSNKSTESRTHALNILRALFRCSDLNDSVGEYIADGVICAIRGYSANTWAERNSSTLLFSALITRIFGVQRTKDWENLNVRNRMTGRIFFLRYPQLYDFFLVELKEASTCIQRNERPAKLHPLLLILSRLYPSALEGTESNLKISSFIEYVSICSGSAEMTTRVLTAKAIVAFMTIDAIESRISEVFGTIKTHIQHANPNQNYIHGLLLQVLYMAKSHKALADGNYVTTVQNIMNVSSILKPNPVTFKVCVDIILELLGRQPTTELSSDVYSSLMNFANIPLIYHPDFSKLYPVFRKSLFVFNMYRMSMLSLQVLLEFFGKCWETIMFLTFEEMETCLNMMILILLGCDDSSTVATYECDNSEVGFVKTIDKDSVHKLKDEFRSSPILRKCLKEVVTNRRFYPECTKKAYAILSRLPSVTIDLPEFVRTAKQYPDDVRDAMAQCLESYVENRPLSDTELQLCLDFIENLTLPWNSDDLRMTAAKIIHHLYSEITSSTSKCNSKHLVQAVCIMLSLCRDDDSDIRDYVSRTVVVLTESRMENISPSYAPILLIRYLSKFLKNVNDAEITKEVLRGILSAQIDEFKSNEEDEDNDDSGEVFDKQEANIFAEPYKTFSDCIDILEQCFALDQDVLELINKMSGK